MLDEQQTEDTFPGSPFYRSHPDEYKANIRAAGQYIQSGGKILRFDPKSGMTPLPLGATPEEEAQAKQISDLFEKTYMQTQSPNPAPGVQPAQPTDGTLAPTTQQYLTQNWDNLMQTGDIIPMTDNGDGTWLIRVSDENGNPMMLDGIELDPQYVQRMKQQSAQK